MAGKYIPIPTSMKMNAAYVVKICTNEASGTADIVHTAIDTVTIIRVIFSTCQRIEKTTGQRKKTVPSFITTLLEIMEMVIET